MNKVNEDNSHIAHAILTIREERKLSQEEFAKILGVTRQAVSRWEMGISVPNIKTLVLISEKFGISIDGIIKEPMSKVLDEKGVNSEKTGIVKSKVNRRKIIGFAMTGFGIVGLIVLPVLAEAKRVKEMTLFKTAYEHSYDYIIEYPLSIVLILAAILLVSGVYTIIKSRR